MSKKLHQRTVTIAHFLRPHFFFPVCYQRFIVVINRWWAQSRRSRCSDCSDAWLLWRGEDVSGSPAAYILCKHSTARPHQLFPLTISTPSNFLCFSPLTAFFFFHPLPIPLPPLLFLYYMLPDVISRCCAGGYRKINWRLSHCGPVIVFVKKGDKRRKIWNIRTERIDH